MLLDTLIPHEVFHKYDWYLSEHSNWYFHKYSDNVNIITTGNKFIESVDDLLKPIINVLHDKGVRTTASCSGHFYSRDEYVKIFFQLEMIEQLIKTTGVEFTNIETGETLFIYNPEYKRLQYVDQETFVDKVIEYAKVGILGLKDSSSYFFNKFKEANLLNIELLHQDKYTFIKTTPKDFNECTHLWTEVLRIVE